MKITLVILLISLYLISSAQSDNPETLPNKIYELKVKTMASASLRLPFRSVKIIDSRFDTSKIGFLYSRFYAAKSERPFRLTKLKNGVQQSVESFYNEYYKSNFSSNENKLLIVLKKLWIAAVSSSAIEQTKDFRHTYQQFVYAKFEYYANVNYKYIPLKRIDTIFQVYTTQEITQYNPKDEYTLPFFCFSLENMFEKMNYDNYFNYLTNKRSLTLEELTEKLTKEKQLPILHEQIKQGIFLTFEEFKNNTPSIVSFTKNQIATHKVFELLDSNKNVILHYYACFEGEKLLMPLPYTLLLPGKTKQANPVAYRVGNSFEFTQLIGNLDPGFKYSKSFGIYSTGKNLEYLPRQIDMETGLLY